MKCRYEPGYEGLTLDIQDDELDLAHYTHHDGYPPCINLDCEDNDSLKILYRNRQLHLSQRAYADHLLRARKFRLAGNIVQATKQEKRCKAIYHSLPSNLRW